MASGAVFSWEHPAPTPAGSRWARSPALTTQPGAAPRTSLPELASPSAVAVPSVHLAPGVCVRFAPTRGDHGVTVFVDPGHGGLDTGGLGATTNGTAVQEKNLNLAIGMDLLRILRQDGDTVVMSRVSDTLITRLGPADTTSPGILSAVGLEADLRARVACANASHARLLLGIHLNAFSDPSVGGAEAIYGAGRSFSEQSRRLAAAVEGAVVGALAAGDWAVPDRGVVSDVSQGPPGLTAQSRAYGQLMELGPADPGYFAHPSTMPGAIAEPLFITDPPEASIAASPAGQQAVARGLAAGVQSWLSGAASAGRSTTLHPSAQ